MFERLRALDAHPKTRDEFRVRTNVQRQAFDLEFRWCLRLGETAFGLWTMESVVESHGPYRFSFELSIVRIGLETTFVTRR